MNFVVCPYDGANLRTAGRPVPGRPVPLACPDCGRRFELADGELTEPPSAP